MSLVRILFYGIVALAAFQSFSAHAQSAGAVSPQSPGQTISLLDPAACTSLAGGMIRDHQADIDAAKKLLAQRKLTATDLKQKEIEKKWRQIAELIHAKTAAIGASLKAQYGTMIDSIQQAQMNGEDVEAARQFVFSKIVGSYTDLIKNFHSCLPDQTITDSSLQSDHACSNADGTSTPAIGVANFVNSERGMDEPAFFIKQVMPDCSMEKKGDCNLSEAMSVETMMTDAHTISPPTSNRDAARTGSIYGALPNPNDPQPTTLEDMQNKTLLSTVEGISTSLKSLGCDVPADLRIGVESEGSVSGNREGNAPTGSTTQQLTTVGSATN